MVQPDRSKLSYISSNIPELEGHIGRGHFFLLKTTTIKSICIMLPNRVKFFWYLSICDYLKLLKVSQSQNEFLVSSSLPKSPPNFLQTSVLASSGRNLSRIWLPFWEIWRHQKFMSDWSSAHIIVKSWNYKYCEKAIIFF